MAASTAARSKAKSKTADAIAFSAPIAEVHLVPIELIDIQENVRTFFDKEGIEELAEDIKQRGLMQPVLLNPKGDRFELIAGERRLKAIEINGQKAIPALLTKASNDDALLMQLAENIQRENLNFVDECHAIQKLYDKLGSLKEVSAKVKKSIPWCSKRYALAHGDWHWKVRDLLSDGITEDIELLKALNSLSGLVTWNETNQWCEKVRKAEAGRDEIRDALKAAKAEAKKNAAAAKAATVSHAKIEEPSPPPPPPAWTLQNAIDDLDNGLSDRYEPQTAQEIFDSYTEEQKDQVTQHLQDLVNRGKETGAFIAIANRLSRYDYANRNDMEWMAFIAGFGMYRDEPLSVSGFFANLQGPKNAGE